MKKYALILLALFATVGAHAEPGQIRQRELRSREGARILVRYEANTVVHNSNKPSRALLASPFAISLSSPYIGQAARPRAIVIHRTRRIGSCGLPNQEREEVYGIDLSYNPSTRAFVGALDQRAQVNNNGYWIPLSRMIAQAHGTLVIAEQGFCYQVESQTELAVVINDHWLVDPVNGTHNFRMAL